MSRAINHLKSKIDYLASQNPNVITGIVNQLVGTKVEITADIVLIYLNQIYDKLIRNQKQLFPGSFPHPFKEAEYDFEEGAQPKSKLEKLLLDLSSTIRLKPDWEKKIYDATIVNKWKKETKHMRVTPAEFQYVIDELHYLSSLSQGKIRVSPVDGVWEADHQVEIETKKQLLDCVKQLEDVPKVEQDWHPGSNHQVLDLVHPSLYCFVNGRTHMTEEPVPLSQTLESMGKGTPLMIKSEAPKKNRYGMAYEEDYALSKKYQWLPSEFTVDKDGKVKIESYINNLHPIKHKKLYGVLERIFESFVPMFNKVLTDLINFTNKKTKIEVDADWYESMEEYRKRTNPKSKFVNDEGNKNEVEDDGRDEDDEYDDYYEHKEIKLPEVKSFKPPKIDRFVDLNDRSLQVIVKLANIELSPENPKYPGGSWHVEGMKNEHIVASGIYYYHSENITESHLEFREAIKDPEYEQNDNRGVKEVYGLEDEDQLNQELGYLVTQADRCIAFPNIYQHRVQPFELVNSFKPGHRKILVFFLVDPTQRILSTANVPPQQASWFAGPQMPPSSVMTLKEAEQYREDLMKERKFFIKENTEKFFERPFSLCEH